jgi:hypothetical protein
LTGRHVLLERSIPGSVTVNVEPFCGVLRTAILPWWRSTIHFTRLSPSPAPSDDEDRD